MASGSKKEKFVWIFELATVTALQILIMAAVLVATVILFVLFAQGVFTHVSEIRSVGDLLPAMQRIFAGILIVLLGLELSETMKAYFTRHHIRVEVILIVAIVAVGRHMIQLDFDHIAPAKILGLSALMLSLTVGYFFVKRAQPQLRPADSPAVETESPPNYEE